MSRQNLEIVREIYAEWQRGDMNAGVERFDPETAAGHLAARLATLGPAATLARGYAVVQGLPTDGPPHVLHSVNDAPAGARLRIRVADGALTALSEGAIDDEQRGADEAY